MTREEAIRVLKEGGITLKECEEAFDMAFKALKQDTCDDCISRKAVLDQTYLWSRDEFLRITNPFDYLRKRINDLPPANLQKIGHWKDCAERDPWYRCSECEEKVWGSYHKYCPNCGAKMRSEGKNE